jgi:hypothetical protein
MAGQGAGQAIQKTCQNTISQTDSGTEDIIYKVPLCLWDKPNDDSHISFSSEGEPTRPSCVEKKGNPPALNIRHKSESLK